MDPINRKITVIILVFISSAGSVIFLVDSIFTSYGIPDPPNFITIIVEIHVGFFIAVLVYVISRKQQSRIETSVKKLEQILDEEKKLQENRRKSTYQQMLNYLGEMEYFLSEIEMYSSYDLSEGDKEAVEDSIRYFDEKYKIFWRLFTENSAYFDNDTISILEGHNQKYDVYFSNMDVYNPDFKTVLILLQKTTGELKDIIKKVSGMNDSSRENESLST